MTGTGPRCVKSVLIGISTMSSEHHRIDGTVECREATGSPGRLIGTILPVGRVAGDRAELFVGSGVQTPADGIALLPEHRSTTVVMRFDPIRGDDGTSRRLTIVYRIRLKVGRWPRPCGVVRRLA